ncbi:MAG: HEAT repeat domain-containing protein [Candidatus Thiodiazotropha sp.]
MKVLTSLAIILLLVGAGYWIFKTQNNDIRITSVTAQMQNSTRSSIEDGISRYDLKLEENGPSKNHESFNPASGYSGDERHYTELDWIAMEEDENNTATDILQQLQSMSYDSRPEIRLAVVNAISGYKHEEVIYMLIEALKDSSPDIRIAAVESLSLLADEFMIAYIEPLLYDHNLQVRIATIWAIAEFDNDQGVYALASVLSDRNAEVRLNAVAALGEISGATAIYYLQNLIYDSDMRIQQNVEAILNEVDAEAWH